MLAFARHRVILGAQKLERFNVSETCTVTLGAIKAGLCTAARFHFYSKKKQMNISLDALKAIVEYARSNTEPVDSFAFQTFLRNLSKGTPPDDDTLTYILQVSKSMVGKNLWTDGTTLKSLAGGMEVEIQPWDGMVKQALSLNVHF